MKEFTFIDLFCGAGGFSYGLEKAGFTLKLAIDKNLKYKETFNQNHNNKVFYQFELSENSIDNLKSLKTDLIIGSPPCQGFSDARGCRIPKNKDELIRNSLPFVFLKVIEYFEPIIWVMENVKGLKTYKINEIYFLEKFLKEAKKINYLVDYEILNAANFGIPQNRERIFIIGVHKEYNIFPNLSILQNVKKKIITLKDALYDLPLKLNYENKEFPNYTIQFNKASNYQKLMRDENSEEIYNHEILNYPNKFEKKIIKRIPPGKIYRSSRFGQKYIGVWELFKDDLKPDERELLYFLCKKRILSEYKENKKKYQEGFIKLEKFPVDKNGKFKWDEISDEKLQNHNRTPKEIINSLVKKGWLRKKLFINGKNKFFAYDINTKSGIRPKYRRLSYNDLSPTIQTVSFKVNELIHPEEDRPLTFREGARIQSFPDNFIFLGSKKDIATMIGNAVPPLLAYYLGLYIRTILDHIIGKGDTLEFSKFFPYLSNEIITFH